MTVVPMQLMRAIAIYQTRWSVSNASEPSVFSVPATAEAFMPTMTLLQALAGKGEWQILQLIAGSLGHPRSVILFSSPIRVGVFRLRMV